MWKYLIPVVVFAALVFVLGWLWVWFPYSSLCHAPEKRVYSSVHGTLFSPDGKMVAFAQYHDLYREPVGICTFPDGGGPWILENALKVYSVSADGGQPKLIATVPIPKGYLVKEDGYQLFGWANDSLYVRVNLVKLSEETKAVYAVNVINGSIQKVSGMEQDKTIKQFHSQNTFLPNNPKIWLKYQEGQGIGEYSGGERTLQDQGVALSGMPSNLIRIIVSQQTLESLLPNSSSTKFLQAPGML